jgi:hypothetical protein
MALDQSAKAHIGQDLVASPIYGWGWSDDQPKEFRMKLIELVESGDKLLGGYGRINQSEHKYHGYLVVFFPRHEGSWDFVKKRGDHQVCLYKELPAGWREMIRRFRASEIPRGYSTCGTVVIGTSSA